MKVQMYGEVKFYLDLDLLTVVDLRRLALVHYDAVCRSTANDGAILSRWELTLTTKPKECYEGNTAWWPQATWRELDTLCKVCEQARIYFDMIKDPEALVRINKFSRAVGHVLRESYAISKGWQHEFNDEVRGQ
jgi:EAL domain-containing protein (putative c-di-GMP-specific phosphodiesterase class I)